jgi:hypothetical protein
MVNDAAKHSNDGAKRSKVNRRVEKHQPKPERKPEPKRPQRKTSSPLASSRRTPRRLSTQGASAGTQTNERKLLCPEWLAKRGIQKSRRRSRCPAACAHPARGNGVRQALRCTASSAKPALYIVPKSFSDVSAKACPSASERHPRICAASECR